MKRSGSARTWPAAICTALGISLGRGHRQGTAAYESLRAAGFDTKHQRIIDRIALGQKVCPQPLSAFGANRREALEDETRALSILDADLAEAVPGVVRVARAAMGGDVHPESRTPRATHSPCVMLTTQAKS